MSKNIDYELGQIKGTLDVFAKNQTEHNQFVRESLTNMDGRLRAVEQDSKTVHEDVKAALTELDARQRETEKRTAVSSMVVSGLVAIGTSILTGVIGRKIG